MAVAERAARELLVGGRRPGRTHARLDEAAQEPQSLGRTSRVGKDRAVLRGESRAVGPERLQHVDDEPFVLLALPHVAVERRVPLAGANAVHLLDELLVGLRRAQAVLREQVGAIVEKADVEVPRQRPHAVAVGRRGDRARKVGRELVGLQTARQVQEPTRAGELGDPDAVEHHHVEAGAPALEVDDVELVLIVRRPRQGLALDPHTWVGGLELAQKTRQWVGVAEDARVLEHERDRPALLPGGATAERQEADHQYEWPRGVPQPRGHDPRSRVRRRASPRSGMPSQAGRLSSS